METADQEHIAVPGGEAAVGYVYTPDFPDLLVRLRASLLVTTYQAQRVLAFSVHDSRMSMLMRTFDRPTGMALEDDALALVSALQIWLFEAKRGVSDAAGKALPGDLCFLPRSAYVTGDISGHEIAWVKEELVVVNTRFSCLCRVCPHYSFEPIWRPPFISALLPEDRCHLNGLAVDSAGIRYVTALGATDTDQGWRPNKVHGGVLVAVPSGDIVASELSMPHCPRLHGGKLWILESGRGELQTVDMASGVREIVCRLPGYLRGLDFCGDYAFVGMCKIRESNMFGGVPISEQCAELKCAIAAVHAASGKVAGYIEFTKGIEELFDLKVLPGVRDPHLLGFEEQTVNRVYSLA